VCYRTINNNSGCGPGIYETEVGVLAAAENLYKPAEGTVREKARKVSDCN